MFNTWLQYAFIFIVFGVAVWYVFNMLRASFSGKKKCSKDCGCSTEEEKKA